jgi:DNA-directed RNA polymerase specialized sigma24 family protein
MLTSSLAVAEADQPLVILLKTKSLEAFSLLYDRYAGALYGFICRTYPDTTQAEALLQEVFVRVWKGVECYDPSKERLFTWIFRITLSVCGQSQEPLKTINL